MSAQRRRNKPLDLVGRVAVVTGASRGAGRAFAAVLGEQRRRGDGLEENTVAEKERIAGIYWPSGGGTRW